MKEIRKDIREYILSEVNETLARLGVSEKVCETKEWKGHDFSGEVLRYEFESAPIKSMPVMFKSLIVEGYMVAQEPTQKDIALATIITVSLSWSYSHFGGGHNGCDLGRMTFVVSADIPDELDECFVMEYYVKKRSGLSI